MHSAPNSAATIPDFFIASSPLLMTVVSPPPARLSHAHDIGRESGLRSEYRVPLLTRFRQYFEKNGFVTICNQCCRQLAVAHAGSRRTRRTACDTSRP